MSPRGVSEIPISKTRIDLLGMDFVDYGGQAAFLQMRDTFSRYPMIVFMGNKTKTEQTAGKVEDAILTHLVGFFGTPDIIIADNGLRFTGGGRKCRSFACIAISLYRR